MMSFLEEGDKGALPIERLLFEHSDEDTVRLEPDRNHSFGALSV